MKYYLVLAVVLMAVLLVGCAKEKTEQTTTSAKTTTAKTTTSTTTNTASSSTVDLFAMNITTSSPSFEVGDQTTIYPVIKNIGKEVKGVEIELYAGDKMIKSYIYDFKAGEIKSPFYMWYPEKAGTYVISVQVDPGNSIKESDEDNNMISKNIEIS